MGFFSWITSDTDKSVSNASSIRGALPVYVLCPDGSKIFEDDYDGYGVFGGHDVYDLVAEWNRESATAANMRKPKREHWGADEEGEKWYQKAVERYEHERQRLQDFQNGLSDEYMREVYGEDWKRLIGISIACYDDQNAALEFPIKIVEDGTLKYTWVKPSKGCPEQGYFYCDDEDDDW